MQNPTPERQTRRRKRRRSKPLNAEKVCLQKRVRERRKAGGLLGTIASEFGLSKSTVSRWCQDIKVTPSALQKRVRERRKAGVLLGTIASEFGLSKSTVSRWCQDIKIPTSTEMEIIGLLKGKQIWRTSEIVKHSKSTKQAVMGALKSLLEKGVITKIKRGHYQKSNGENAKHLMRRSNKKGISGIKLI